MRVAGHVDEQMAEQAIDEPWRHAAVAGLGDLRKRDLHLIERLVARFIDARRLARRPDEQSGEEIGERGVVLPVGDDARQHVRAAQEGAVGRRDAAHDDVIATTGADMTAVEQELLGAEPRLVRLLVDARRDGDELLPARCGMDVDLDHAGIGRDLDDVQARVGRRRIALDMHLNFRALGALLDRSHERGEIEGVRERRQEYAQMPIARLDGECGTHRSVDLVRTRRRGYGRGFQRHGAPLLDQDAALRQRRGISKGVTGKNVRIVDRAHGCERGHGQAQAARRITGRQEKLLAPDAPPLGHPAASQIRRMPNLDRQHVADRRL